MSAQSPVRLSYRPPQTCISIILPCCLCHTNPPPPPQACTAVLPSVPEWPFLLFRMSFSPIFSRPDFFCHSNHSLSLNAASKKSFLTFRSTHPGI